MATESLGVSLPLKMYTVSSFIAQSVARLAADPEAASSNPQLGYISVTETAHEIISTVIRLPFVDSVAGKSMYTITS